MTARKPRPTHRVGAAKRLDDVEEMRAPERRTHLIWVEPNETDAEIEQKRLAMIAEGRANADDEFVPIGWKG